MLHRDRPCECSSGAGSRWSGIEFENGLSPVASVLVGSGATELDTLPFALFEGSPIVPVPALWVKLSA